MLTQEGQNTDIMSPEFLLEVTRATIDLAEYCFLITVNKRGQANSRLVQPFPVDEDMTVWIGTGPNTRKIREIRHNPNVTLAFQYTQGGAYTSLLGTAWIEDNVEHLQQYWRDTWSPFFDGGAAGGNYCLIRFVPQRIEVMSFARDVTPEPYGLKPAALEYANDSWVVDYDDRD